MAGVVWLMAVDASIKMMPTLSRTRMAVVLLALVVAGCDEQKREAAPVPATGPPSTIRVAVETLGDPTIARNVVEMGHKPPFRVIDAGPKRIVAVRPGLRVEFVRMEPHRAALAFRRAEVDVAPIALGDIKAVQLDPALHGSVHVRALRGLDLIRFDSSVPPPVRRFLWRAVDRADYRRLVAEDAAGAAYGLLQTAPPVKRPGLGTLKEEAKALRARYPGTWVRLAGGYEAELVAAFWREVGATVFVTRRNANAHFERVLAPYGADEALFVALLGRDARGKDLAALDQSLRDRAEIVPIAWVASGKLVSRRLVGWGEDELGTTDYSRVHIRGG
jgi:hypothetical protein